MTKTLITLAAAAAIALAQPVPKSYKDLKYPPINKIKIPPVVKHTLANGITLFLVEDHELPTIRAQALIRTGERHEPASKAGLAEITLRVLRTGGTPARPGDALDKELDRLAASVESGAGGNSSNATMFVLKEDVDKGLTILADILQNPAFPQEKIELAKLDMRDTVGRRNDDATGIHYREMARLLYGKASPYARQQEFATIDAITREDLVAFHKEYFQPENLMIAVWGDFTAADMKARLEKAFGGWARGGRPKPAVPAVDKSAQAKGIFQINKDDVNQSTIGMGFLLGKRNDPDYHALVVMTSILGGGFGSRMFDSIRTKEGLAYAAYAGYSAEYDHDGSWFARVGTKSQSTVQALNSIKREIARMKQGEPTDDEMARAKDSILKGEAFDYDSTAKIVGRLVAFEYYGYPADYLERYRAGIDKVTKADVLRVAKQYLTEDNFVTLVLGNTKDFDQQLSSLGKVSDVDITIPQPEAPKTATVPAATPESQAKGKALLDRARQAHGGAALLNAKDYTAKVATTIVTPQGEMPMNGERAILLSGKMLMKIGTPMGEMVQGFDGTRLWMKTPQGTRDMPGDNAADAKVQSMRETLTLLTTYDKPGFTLQALGTSKLDNKDVEGVLIKNDAAKLEVKVFVDPATGFLAGKAYTGQIPMAPRGEITESLLDVQEVGGVKLAHRVVQTAQGKKVSEQRFSEVKLNTGLTDAAFARPH